VNKTLFHRDIGNDLHPFMKFMSCALRNEFTNTESYGVFGQIDIPTTTLSLPPSKRYFEFIDMKDNLQPGVDPDTTIMSHLANIMMIDWRNDERLKGVPNLPEGEEWKCLEELVGEGKRYHCFHYTGLFPYLMNLKKAKIAIAN
jgi:hypothetical protein